MDLIAPVNDLKATEIFYVPNYHTVHTEDGVYQTRHGNNVIARIDGAYGARFEWTLIDESGEPAVAPDDSVDAKDFANRLEGGRWSHISTISLDDLPDYVLNPWRPEYN